MASSRKRGQHWQQLPEKELATRAIGAGYRAIGIKHEGRQQTFYVHRLVAEAFIQRPADCNEVNHLDGDKANNHVANLEWTTHARNLQHAAQAGLHASTYLTPADVREVRRLLASGRSLSAIAKDFGVSHSAISHLKHGRSWAWLA
jgi:DNA-binding NarL/FixJ family response regulator